MFEIPERLLGGLLALSSALTWAFGLVLFKRSGEFIAPLPLNLFKNTVALILLSATLWLMPLGHRDEAGPSLRDLAILSISGVLGIAVADTLFLHGLNRLGVGLMSLVECTYSPSVMFFAFLLIDERLTALQLFGVALILSAIALVSAHRPPPGRSRADLLVGFACGLAAIFVLGFAIVIAKPALQHCDAVTASTIRLGAGTVVIVVVAVVRSDRAKTLAVFRPARTWITALPAAFLGTYLSLITWVGGFKYAEATVAASLNQTSAIFSLLLATWLLREPLTRRKLMAVVLAFTGVACAMGGKGP